MRLPRPRFTLRWLMVAVAILGGSLGVIAECVRLQALARRYEAKADEHRLSWGVFASEADLNEYWRIRWMAEARSHLLKEDSRGVQRSLSNSRQCDADRERARRMAAYHDEIKLKYLRAARHPWLPVAPDPPEPE